MGKQSNVLDAEYDASFGEFSIKSVVNVFVSRISPYNICFHSILLAASEGVESTKIIPAS